LSGHFLEKAVAASVRRARLMKRVADNSTSISLRPRSTSFSEAIKKSYVPGKRPAIIVEYKRCSPGRVISNIEPWDYVRATRRYADAYSVLVEPYWFCGSSVLVEVFAREKPVLYKDFIVDEIQLEDAVVSGASAVLLILEVFCFQENSYLIILNLLK
jgi:indole-3-glycerol phosphate synthase